MNYVGYINRGKEYFIMTEDNELPKELKKVLENKENKIIEISVDGFIIENYKWILKYHNDNWTDEYCKRLKNRDGIRI